jgi:thiol-disulfide isomerase/thioredoxin
MAGDRSFPFQPFLQKLSTLLMNKTLFHAVLLGLCLWAVVCPAQKPLTVGDTLPPELWNLPLQVINHPEGKSTITLADYKDKLIILDFWATWCSPCVKSLTKLDSIQKLFSEELIVLPTTKENLENIQNFLKKRSLNLPSVAQDLILPKYFLHHGIPFQVWISGGKIVCETSNSIWANTENINKALTGNYNDLQVEKPYQKFDPSRPILHNNNGGNINDADLRSVLSKRINASIGGINRTKNSIRAYNVGYETLLYEIFNSHIPYHGRRNRIVWEIDSLLLKEIRGEARNLTGKYQEDLEYYEGLAKNQFCYELYVSPDLHISKEALKQLMKNDVENYFKLYYGIQAEIEKRRTKTLVIVDLENVPNENSAQVSLKDIAIYAQAVLASQSLPVVNKVTTSKKVKKGIPNKKYSIPEIISELNKVGLNLIEQEETIDVIVVKNIER